MPQAVPYEGTVTMIEALLGSNELLFRLIWHHLCLSR
jgi:hypothetical protein